MRRIELLGAPGSAKSTIARQLVRTLPDAVDLETAALIAVRDRGHDGLARMIARLSRSKSNPLWKWAYARSPDRFAALTRFINSNPEVMQRVAKTQRLRSDRDRHQDFVLSWVLNLMARYQLATEATGGFENLVIDEGFCQRAVALFGYGFREEDAPLLEEYLKAIPLPQVVVLVETPLEVCEKRLEKRGWSDRVAGLDPVGRHDFLMSSAAVVAAVVRFLEPTETRLITVDGTIPARESGLSLGASLAS